MWLYGSVGAVPGLDPVHEQADGFAPEAFAVMGDGGQWRSGKPAGVDIIEADDAQISGDFEALLGGCFQEAPGRCQGQLVSSIMRSSVNSNPWACMPSR